MAESGLSGRGGFLTVFLWFNIYVNRFWFYGFRIFLDYKCFKVLNFPWF